VDSFDLVERSHRPTSLPSFWVTPLDDGDTLPGHASRGVERSEIIRAVAKRLGIQTASSARPKPAFATLGKRAQKLFLKLQISCSNRLSYAGALDMKADLMSSSRVLPTIAMHHG
jgi:hypothetical protein